MAGLLIGPNITVNGSHFDHLVFGYGPYGVMKETSGGTGTGLPTTSSTRPNASLSAWLASAMIVRG